MLLHAQFSRYSQLLIMIVHEVNIVIKDTNLHASNYPIRCSYRRTLLDEVD